MGVHIGRPGLPMTKEQQKSSNLVAYYIWLTQIISPIYAIVFEILQYASTRQALLATFATMDKPFFPLS